MYKNFLPQQREILPELDRHQAFSGDAKVAALTERGIIKLRA